MLDLADVRSASSCAAFCAETPAGESAETEVRRLMPGLGIAEWLARLDGGREGALEPRTEGGRMDLEAEDEVDEVLGTFDWKPKRLRVVGPALRSGAVMD